MSVKVETVWSEEYNCYVSRSFAPDFPPSNPIKIDITKCTIRITIFGFYELWLGNRKLKSIQFHEFQKFKKFVKDIKEDS